MIHTFPGFEILGAGPPRGLRAPLTSTQRSTNFRQPRTQQRLENVAVLDFETDPFDSSKPDRVRPFLAVLYSDQWSPKIIWEENEELFLTSVLSTIEDLPDAWTIYAHNGGKFDYMFLVHRLRGYVLFKGRGIMEAHIGRHTIRDSYNIIPERLAGYAKQSFDYRLLERNRRIHSKDDIIKYCVSDCKYLFEIVKEFLLRYGFKLSIGQAAMAAFRNHYTVKNLSEREDTFLRRYFFGGRVECLAGPGDFRGPYKLYDVNSMYPYAMATYKHPTGTEYYVRTGKPSDRTVFLEVECENNHAFVSRTEAGETTARIKSGCFLTTIWEYNVARRYDLLKRVRILRCIDFVETSAFPDFVLPLYGERLQTKQWLNSHKMSGDTPEYMDVKRKDIFLKLILNNCYGKFAQNPRRFKDFYITDPDEWPPKEWFIPARDEEIEIPKLPTFTDPRYWIWERPAPYPRFNHVGTAASITGAARATLLEAMLNAENPIYCDTDSLIAYSLSGVKIDAQELGAWDMEQSLSRAIIAGKKEYALFPENWSGDEKQIKVRVKGASGLTYRDLERMLAGETRTSIASGPTLTKFGQQYYMRRNVKATASTERLFNAQHA